MRTGGGQRDLNESAGRVDTYTKRAAFRISLVRLGFFQNRTCQTSQARLTMTALCVIHVSAVPFLKKKKGEGGGVHTCRKWNGLILERKKMLLTGSRRRR